MSQEQNMIVNVAGLNIDQKFRGNIEQIVENRHSINHVFITSEPDNQYDSNALAVFLNTSAGDFQIGYVAKKDHEQLRMHMPKVWAQTHYGRIYSSGVGGDNTFYCQVEIMPRATTDNLPS